MRRRVTVGLMAVAVACGEPAVDVEFPARDAEQRHVVDQAGILDATALEEQLAALADDGSDIVALTYETPQASCGEAFRAAREFVDDWDADIAIVAVARPGEFTSTAQDRQRCVGVQPRDDRALPADLRERIAEELVPPFAADNDWDGAFNAAVQALAAQ